MSLRTSAALPLTQHNQAIVPWAAEQEVEEWEPAAGYEETEESTFPSLGLLPLQCHLSLGEGKTEQKGRGGFSVFIYSALCLFI